jgi:hypothetical protein
MSVDTGSLFGIFAFIISSAGVIYTAVNHKRFRLKCCGKDLDVSVDVEDTDDATHEKKRTKKERRNSQVSSGGNESSKKKPSECQVLPEAYPAP